MKKSLSFLFCIIAYLSVRLLLLFSTTNYIATWETVSTANIVFSKIYTYKQLLAGSLHPFYRILLKAFLSVFDNPLIYAPVLNLILSMFLGVAVYLCIREFFGKANAVFSLFVLGFVPVIALQAVISTEIVLMHLLLMLSFYLMKKYQQSTQNVFLFSFLVVINLAHLTRFESWVLLPCFILWFLKGQDNKMKKVAVLFAMLIVPILSFVYKNPLHDIAEQSLNSIHAIKVIGENGFKVSSGLSGFFNWFVVMSESVGILFLLFAFLGIALSFYHKKELFYAVSVLFMLLVFCLKSVKGDIIPHPRYITIVVLMLVPYVFYFMQHLLEYRFFKTRSKPLVLVMAFVFAVNMFFLKFKVYGQTLFSLKDATMSSSEYLYKDKGICDAVLKYVPKEANVFVDTDYYGRDYDDIIAYGLNADVNLIFFEDSSFFEDKDYAEKIAVEMKKSILRNKPIYFVLSEKGAFEFLFGKNPSFMKNADKLVKYKQWSVFYLKTD